MKRASVELSANFLVMIIVAIVVLGMGVYLTKDIVSEGGEMQAQLDERTKQQIWSLLDSGDPVVTPLNRATVKPGDLYVFGVGVRNVDALDDFHIETLDKAERPTNCIGTGNEPSVTVVRNDPPRTIDQNKQDIFNVVVEVDKKTPSCDAYIVNIKVKKANAPNDYGTPQKLYVTVP